MDDHRKPLDALHLTRAQIDNQGLIVLADQYGGDSNPIQLNGRVLGGILPGNSTPDTRKFLAEAMQDSALFFKHKLVAIHVVGDKLHKCIAIPKHHLDAWKKAVREAWDSRPTTASSNPDRFSREDRYRSACPWRNSGHRLGGKGKVRGFIG